MWTVIGASVAGASHVAAGTSCQDASDWLALPGDNGRPGLTCLVVADGAGSRPRSATGASEAVAAVLRFAGRRPLVNPSVWVADAFAYAAKALVDIADEEDAEVADYATTLAVAVLDGGLAGVGQIGDTIVVVRGAQGYETLDPEPRHEYLNETAFLTQEHAVPRICVREGVDEVFLSTDGLRFKILDNLQTSAPYPPFFEDVAAYVRGGAASVDAVRAFLEGLDDQTGDDKTLVAAVRPPEASGSTSAVRPPEVSGSTSAVRPPDPEAAAPTEDPSG